MIDFAQYHLLLISFDALFIPISTFLYDHIPAYGLPINPRGMRGWQLFVLESN